MRPMSVWAVFWGMCLVLCSGQLMLEKLLAGEADVVAIAELAQRKAKQKIPELIRVLAGHRLRDHHRRLIRFSFEHLAFLENQIACIDEEIATIIRENSLDAPYQLLGSLPGVQGIAAAAILAETGADMQVFQTAAHLSSWAGLAPGNRISGGTAKPAGISRGNRWLRTTLVESAWGASRMKDGPLKEQFMRLAVKGRKKALVAVAHSLAVLVWHTLSSGQPWQRSDGQPVNEVKRQRLIRHYIRRLGKLGVEVCSLRPAPNRVYCSRAGTRVEVENTKNGETNPRPPLPKLGPLNPQARKCRT